MLSLKKKIFIIFLSSFFVIGSFNSLKTGISFDENYEELNWKFNISVVSKLSEAILKKNEFNKESFDKEVKRFVGYGIGFQIISQPIQKLIKNIFNYKDINSFGAKLISKHFVVFLFFFISGLFFYLILKKLSDNENFNFLSTAVYYIYPYLYGQAMFSPKDIPFMSVWLVCTYLSFSLIEKLINFNQIKNLDLILFSIITAYLISIRFAGILIFIQYFILIVLYLNIYKKNFFIFFKDNLKKLSIFLSLLISLTFVLNPIFLIDPFLIIKTFMISANHFNNVGTTTLGTIMYSKNLPSTYLPIWFSVKLPLICLLGLILIPFSDKKIFNDKKNSVFFGNILLSVAIIFLILIFRKVHLYDEIRQVMFLIPLIFIISLFSLFIFQKKLFYLFGFISIIFFTIENIKINPYQYVWFNTPSRVLDLSKNFELEYQGISGREIAYYIKTKEDPNICILVNPIHSVKPFLVNSNFKCFDIWQKIDSDYQRPFLAVQNVRNLKKSMPYGCKQIYETSLKLFFQKKKFVTGKLLKCS